MRKIPFGGDFFIMELCIHMDLSFINKKTDIVYSLSYVKGQIAGMFVSYILWFISQPQLPWYPPDSHESFVSISFS